MLKTWFRNSKQHYINEFWHFTNEKSQCEMNNNIDTNTHAIPAESELNYWFTCGLFAITVAIWLPHWGRVTHICISELGYHWFMQWLIAHTPPSHYLNQWWLVVKRMIKLQWNLNQNVSINIQENGFENVICKIFLSGSQCVRILLTNHQWDPTGHCWIDSLSKSQLTHLSLDKMAAISQTTFSDAFSLMKSFLFWLKFHWSLFLRVHLTITQHWFR